MKTEKYSSAKVRSFLKKHKIANMKQLMKELGTPSRNTVILKLKELECVTSYSHNGTFYTLKELCSFNRNGTWSYDGVLFSSAGTLVNTAMQFIEQSTNGMSVAELDGVLHVSTKLSLLNLFKDGKIYREKHGGVFVYFAKSKKTRKDQIIKRSPRQGDIFSNSDAMPNDVKAAIILFFGLLDEHQRRLFVGLESIKIGKGGDAKIATIFGVDPHTVARGKKELIDRDLDMQKIRRKGGGRKSIEKKVQK